MLKHRIIPTLLLDGDRLVKTRQFKKNKYVGDPINTIRIFNEKEADEIMVLDINATKNNRPPNFSLIEDFAGECFMPLSYGGGIRTIEQARKLFSLGVEKVCVQSKVIEDMSFISELASKFGSQSIVVSIDIKKNMFGIRQIYSSAKGKVLNIPWKKFLRESVNAGAGEILLTAVHCDGIMQGMDYEIIREASENIEVPLVASGGVGCLADIKKAVTAGASAVAVGSLFVFYGPYSAVLINYPSYQELEDLLRL